MGGCRYQRARDTRALNRLAEVVAWLDDPSAEWPFSFERICAELELDAARILGMLR